VLRTLCFVLGALYLVLRLLLHSAFPFAFCLLPSAVCLLPSASCLLPPASCFLLSAFCLLLSAFCFPDGVGYIFRGHGGVA
jgi:hypothetical protein